MVQRLPNGMLPGCPVCNSPYTGFVREVPTIRTRRNIPLYTCLDCLSFWNPSGYAEDDKVREIDLRWGLSVEERNQKAAHKLFDHLAQLNVVPRSIVEIGCGIGTLLAVAEQRGCSAMGYETNNVAAEYGRSHGRDIRTELWTRDTCQTPPDLILCISVLEHIEQPRPLLEELCRAASQYRSALFVSVPFVEKARWPYILNPDPSAEGTPFFDNDVHVTHFSAAGLMRAMQEFGSVNILRTSAGIWAGILATPENPGGASNTEKRS